MAVLQKSTPVAKALRTFNKAMAASVVAVLGIDWITNWKVGLSTLILGAVASAIAALAAFLMAFRFTIESPVNRALASSAQHLAGGLVAIPVLDALEPEKIFTFGQGLGRVAIAALLSGVLTFLTNQAEDSGA